MSFTIYCIICTIIAGIYFSVNFAMDVIGKDKKAKESVEEFFLADSMEEEGSVIIQETSEDGGYNVIKDPENKPETKEENDQSSGNDGIANEDEHSSEEDSQQQTESEENEVQEEEHQDEGQFDSQEYINRVNNSIAENCEPFLQKYQQIVPSEDYVAYMMSVRSKSSDAKIYNILEKV